MTVRDEFNVHLLNEGGIQRARRIAEVYSDTLTKLEDICGPDGREMAIVRTKLQESAFFAKRAMAVREENQLPPSAG
jgi:hypothetical protein